MRHIYIIDFDDTLFQTRVFWRKFLFPQYERIGIPFEVLEKVYIASTYKKFGYFIPPLFLRELKKTCRKNGIKTRPTELKKIFEKTVYSNKARSYFYPGAINFLKQVRKSGNPRILLSSGDRGFKNKLFRSLGLGVFFPQFHITKKPKKDFIKKLRPEHPVILVNDVLKETEDMVRELQKVSPKTRAFFVDYGNRFKLKDVKKPIALIHSLSEIKIL